MTDEPNKVGRPLEWTDERIQEEADALIQWMTDNKFSCWLKDFAIEREYPAEYFSRWADQHPGFNQALKRVKDMQESRLFQDGANPGTLMDKTMAIFALKNHHGWKDTQHTENRSDVTISTSGALAELQGRFDTAGADPGPVEGSDG